ncbi:MAG: hypothetical protein IT445_06360 [Phycisphaeraceae bacterium]|nr:hypothetical protein [Phycisphaeraceae bacterium]
MFCDLKGSTAYKEYHQPFQWLEKTTTHNALVASTIQRPGSRGLVVKYMGDGVLSIWKGKNKAAEVLETAISVVETIVAANRKYGRNGYDEIVTRIGVCSGDVYFFTYPTATVADPIGPTVDMASRFCGLAMDNGVVCSAAVFHDAGGKATFPNSCGPKKRLIKGCSDFQDVCALAPSGSDFKRCDDIPYFPTPEEDDDKTRDTIDKAERLARSGKPNDVVKAVEYLEEITKENHRHFYAHLRVAQILIQREDSGDLVNRLDRAYDHLCMAKQLRPESASPWLYMGRLFQRKTAESTTDENVSSNIAFALTHANQALQAALRIRDIGGEILAKTLIAELYIKQHELQLNKKAIHHAQEAVVTIRDRFDSVHRAESDALVTSMLVSLQTLSDQIHENQFKQWKKDLAKARMLWPYNHRIADAEAKLMKIMASSSGQFPP